METWVTVSWVILAVHGAVGGTSVPHVRSALIWAVTSFSKLLPSQVTREPLWGRRDGRYSISLLYFSRAKLPSSKTSIMVSDGLYFRAGWQQEGIGFRNSHLAFATVCPLPCSASSQLSHNPSAHSSWTRPHAQSRRASSEVCRRQSASQQALLQADHKKEVGLSVETFLRAYCGLSTGKQTEISKIPTPPPPPGTLIHSFIQQTRVFLCLLDMSTGRLTSHCKLGSSRSPESGVRPWLRHLQVCSVSLAVCALTLAPSLCKTPSSHL